MRRDGCLVGRFKHSGSVEILFDLVGVLSRDRFRSRLFFVTPVDDLVVDIGIITNINNIIADTFKVTVEHVRDQATTEIPDMNQVVNGWSAGIHR